MSHRTVSAASAAAPNKASNPAPPADDGPGLADDGRRIQGLLGTQLLKDPDRGVGDHHQTEQTVLIGPTTSTMANNVPMIALKRVKTLARTISPVERDDRAGTSLT